MELAALAAGVGGGRKRREERLVERSPGHRRIEHARIHGEERSTFIVKMALDGW